MKMDPPGVAPPGTDLIAPGRLRCVCTGKTHIEDLLRALKHDYKSLGVKKTA